MLAMVQRPLVQHDLPAWTSAGLPNCAMKDFPAKCQQSGFPRYAFVARDPKAERRSGETGGNCRGALAKGVRHVRRRLHYVSNAPLNNTIDEIARPALSTPISDAFVIFATTHLAHYSLCHIDMAKGEVD